MPFWTLFWLIIPPILLLTAGTVFFVLTGRKNKWTRS